MDRIKNLLRMPQLTTEFGCVEEAKEHPAQLLPLSRNKGQKSEPEIE
jgi:hypothetical protein